MRWGFSHTIRIAAEQSDNAARIAYFGIGKLLEWQAGTLLSRPDLPA
jgi:hypothetical protein